MTFSATLRYFNLFLFTTFSLHFLVCILNISLYTTLMNSNLFLFTTNCFTPLWYVRIKMLIGVITCCSIFSGCFIHEGRFFKGLDVPSFFVSVIFFYIQSFNFRCTLLTQLIFFNASIKGHFSSIYNPSRRFKLCCMKSKKIRLRFIASSFQT